MREFKGTKGKWSCVFTLDKSRAVRNKGGLIAKIYKPSKYPGQDKRYDEELEEARCNQRLIAAAPEMLEALQTLTRFHSYEQEGIGSGQPTPKEWMMAVDKANKAITKAIGQGKKNKPFQPSL